MKILVTGANGYLGTGIVKALCDKNIEVIAACFPNANGVDSRAKAIVANIFEIDNPFIFFEKPDVVLHLAYRNGFVHNAETHLQDLPLHETFLKKLVEGGIKQVSVMGTMHEIGFFEGCIDENTPTNPQSMYGISKNELRKSTFELCKKNNVIYQWLRGFYIVGNSESGNSIFSKITVAEKEGQQLFPFTSGENKYDFLDYDVFCNMVSCCVAQNKVDGIINICSGTPESLGSRVEKFIKENGYKIKLDYNKFPDRPYDSKIIFGNNEKISKIMNFTID